MGKSLRTAFLRPPRKCSRNQYHSLGASCFIFCRDDKVDLFHSISLPRTKTKLTDKMSNLGTLGAGSIIVYSEYFEVMHDVM